MSGCDLYLEKRARETDGEIKTGRGPILPALFSGVRLRRPRVCQRSRRAGRCTDSSLHAGRLLFTKKEKKKKSAPLSLAAGRRQTSASRCVHRAARRFRWGLYLPAGFIWGQPCIHVGGAQSFRRLTFLFSDRYR